MKNNPFSFDERKDMINLVFQERGFRENIDYTVVPFLIEIPSTIAQCVPA
jgi:hypothetical protein